MMKLHGLLKKFLILLLVVMEYKQLGEDFLKKKYLHLPGGIEKKDLEIKKLS